MSILEWVFVIVIFAIIGTVMNAYFKPQSFAARRMVGVISFISAWYVIYLISEILFRLGIR